MLSNLKRRLFFGCKAILGLFLLVLLGNLWVESSTQKQVFDNLNEIPKNNVALVLGTSKYTKNGYHNPYFTNRIKAAADLYHAGKVQHLLVSGDNSLKEYNEPVQMLQALMKKGVPIDAITLDYAGFRTLDSVVRSKEVFGQQQITIISQKFHNQRAVFIANYRGIEAIAYNAKGVGFRFGLKTMVREYLARCKAIIDLIILNKQPKFLGEKIIITV